MKRIKNLDGFQKGVLLVLTAMVLVFSVVYPVTISRKGFAYKDAILVPSQENGNTVYSGKIQGKKAVFTVSADKTVQFRYGARVYGPFTVKEDPTAIPKDVGMAESKTGIELREGDKILFRGAVMEQGGFRWLCGEDGTWITTSISVTTNGGYAVDEHGNIIDPMKPSVSTILELMAGPVLTQKGEWGWWFFGVFVCAATAISILFADELFRWNLAFRIRNTHDAEPSDWEIGCRYLSWGLTPILVMVIFFSGLR